MSDQSSPSNTAPSIVEESGPSWKLTVGTTLIMITAVAATMGYVLLSQISNYNAVLSIVTSSRPTQDALVLALSRSLDAAVIKTCSIFVAFLLIFLGGVYSMTVARAAYKLSVGALLPKASWKPPLQDW